MALTSDVNKAIEEFKKRIEVDGLDFCLDLFEHATIRLMSHKYAYYIKNHAYLDDIAYDIEEKSWYTMGRALDLITEDMTSPCIDFDYNHPYADQGIKLASKLLKLKG